MLRTIIIAVTLVCFYSSCASSTIVRSTDPKAKIYVEGQYKGIGQATHSDTKTAFGSSTVRLEKEGCREQNFIMDRGQEFQAGPFIAGLFFLIPFLWVSGYRAENTFTFQCEKI